MTGRTLVLALGVVALSWGAVLVRLADAPPLAVAAFRMLLASLMLLPLGLMRARLEMAALLRRSGWLVLGAGGCLALHFALWIASLSHTSVASSVVLVTATPLFVALASWLLFAERLRTATFAGIAVSLVGAMFIGYAGVRHGGTAVCGNVLALSAAVAMAGYLLIGRRVRRSAGLLPYTTVVFSAAALLLLAAAALSGTPFSGHGRDTCLALLALALVPQLMGHMSLNWALRFLPATMVTVAVLGEPVGASFLAWLVLGEPPGLLEVAGGVLMLLGIALAFLRGGAAPSPAG